MKSSLCRTMRSSQGSRNSEGFLLAKRLLLVLSLSFTQVMAQLPSQGSSSGGLPGTTEASGIHPDAAPLAALLEKNSLRGKGKVPFHLEAAFTLTSLDGKSSEQGTIEYWWTESEGHLLNVTAPSFGTVHTLSTSSAQSVAARRSLYLVGELLDGWLVPGFGADFAGGELKSQESTSFGVPLQCMYMLGKGAPPTMPAGNTVCTEEHTGAIRVTQRGGELLVRDAVALFHDTRVAAKVRVTFTGNPLISGDITGLHSFDPAKNTVPLEGKPTIPKTDATSAVALPAGVAPGSKIDGDLPHLPEAARAHGTSGSVWLLATISKTGQLEDIVPLYRTDLGFLYSALTAVKTWRYKPYIMDGLPSTVTTNITVNFRAHEGY